MKSETHITIFLVIVTLVLAGTAAAQPGIRINEVCFKALPGQPQWVELYNCGDSSAGIAGYVLTDEDRNDYTIPKDLGPIPTGGFVVVHFDGLGSEHDVTDFNDNTAELHSEPDLVNPFESEGDQAALYRARKRSPKTIISFVAWGVCPSEKADNAIRAGIWKNHRKKITLRGLPKHPKGPAPVMESGGTLGVVGKPKKVDHRSWFSYGPAQVSPGEINPLPMPFIYLPQDGEQYDHGLFSFSWVRMKFADHYQIQICTDEQCTEVFIDDANLADAYFRPESSLPKNRLYYWRVRAFDSDNQPGPWTKAFKLTIGYPPKPVPMQMPSDLAKGKGANYVVSGQVIDSRSSNGLEGVTIEMDTFSTVTGAGGLWSISGVPSNLYFVYATLEHYSGPYQVVDVNGDTPGVNFSLTGDSSQLYIISLAARKDSEMLCLDGCNESKDEINNGEDDHQWDGSHENRTHYGEHEDSYCPYTAIAMVNSKYGGTVQRDEIAFHVKGRGTSTPFYDLSHSEGCIDDETMVGLRWAFNDCSEAAVHYSTLRPTDAQLIAWIDEGRPVMYSTDIHWMVVDGYRYVDKEIEGQFLNTDNDGTKAWRRFATHDFDSYFVPELGLNARSLGFESWWDSDSDGIVDLDEDERFQCNKNKVDTDKDQLSDKEEIKNYTFHRKYCGTHSGSSPKSLFDIDKDKKWAENDCDSDGDGEFDGGEDINGDGNTPDPGETCMFDKNAYEQEVEVDGFIYSVGESVHLIDATRTYHKDSAYNYELDTGCPDKDDGDPLNHDGSFDTDEEGKAKRKRVQICPAAGVYHLTIDILDNSEYSEPDNTDPQTCWICIRPPMSVQPEHTFDIWNLTGQGANGLGMRLVGFSTADLSTVYTWAYPSADACDTADGVQIVWSGASTSDGDWAHFGFSCNDNTIMHSGSIEWTYDDQVIGEAPMLPYNWFATPDGNICGEMTNTSGQPCWVRRYAAAFDYSIYAGDLRRDNATLWSNLTLIDSSPILLDVNDNIKWAAPIEQTTASAVLVYDVFEDDACSPGVLLITNYSASNIDHTWAFNPSPYDWATDIPSDTKLSWTPGSDAVFHHVYLGLDYNDVNDADTYSPQYEGPCYTDSYDPCSLELNTTYFWRIDEVNNGETWKGQTWRFLVRSYLGIDDFESYENNYDLQQHWHDGSYNGTGSSVFLDSEIFHTGNSKSMKFDYNNDAAPHCSEADHPLGGTEDWTAEDVKALVIYFYGSLSNSAGQLYVRVQDSSANVATVIYDGDANDLKNEKWQEWNIELQEFADMSVDLHDVTRLTFGVGDGVSGGLGTLYFDDIGLYPARCVPKYAIASFDNDCDTDCRDLDLVAREWLDSDETIETDIYEDSVIDFRDFALLADKWLTEQLWP